jgi:hypothetical protein
MAGFVFDQAGVKAMLKEWRALREELRKDEELAMPMVQVIGPGEEPASWRMARRAALSGASFLRHNMAMRAFVDRYIAALTASRDEYLSVDDVVRDSYPRR